MSENTRRNPSTNCECDVRNFLTHQKRTALGPDEFPFWLWRDYSPHLAPVITKIFQLLAQASKCSILVQKLQMSRPSPRNLLWLNAINLDLSYEPTSQWESLSVLPANKNYLLSLSQQWDVTNSLIKRDTTQLWPSFLAQATWQGCGFCHSLFIWF